MIPVLFFQFVVAFGVNGAVAEVENSTICERRLSAPLQVRIAGTVPLTSPFLDGTAENVVNGFTLLEEAVNGEGFFAGRDALLTLSGQPMQVRFTIKDDGHDLQTSQDLYTDMMANNVADYYFTPYEKAHAAQAAATVAGSLIFAYNGMVSTQINPYFFSTSVLSHKSLDSTLDMLRAFGAKNVVFAWENSAEQQAVCEGGKAYAEANGWTVRHSFVIDRVTLAGEIRHCIALGPDAFVACAERDDAVTTVVASRALAFMAQAMVFTSASDPKWVETITPQNANFLTAPIAWHPNQIDEYEDPIFESTIAFANAYRLRFGIEPDAMSAAAAAAGMAIVLAVRNLGRIGTPQEMRQQLLAMDQHTFYRRLKFGADGHLEDKTMLTIQVMSPFPPADRNAENWLHSDIRLVAKDTPGVEELFYPAAAWEIKEMLIYPCPMGSILNQSQLPNRSCVPCPPGSFRPRITLQCLPCPKGTYMAQEGAARCEKCPSGSNCDFPGAVYPIAKEGYYQLRPMDFRLCNPPEVCLGNNECEETHSGFMCANCKPGYTVHGLFAQTKFRCGKCPSQWQNGALLVGVCLVWFGITVGIGYLTVRSSVSIKSMHSIILKKTVNHLQLVSTAWAAGELDGYFNFPTLTVFLSLNRDPLTHVASVDCFFEPYGVKLYEVTTFVGLTIIPLALILNVVVFGLRLFLGLRRFFRTQNQASAGGATNVGKQLKRHKSSSAKDADGADDSSSEEEIPITNALGAAERNLQSRWHRLQDKMMYCVQWSIVSVFVLHPLAVKLLLDGVRCEELDKFRLYLNRDVECNGPEHTMMFWLCITGILFYGVGVPLIFFIVLYRVRKKLLHLPVRKLFGFLYNGFESPWYYFEIVYMLRKGLILLLAATPVLALRIMSMLAMTFVFLALHIFCSPYDNRDYFVLDRMETTSLLSLVCLLLTRLFLLLRDASDERETFIGTVVWHPFWTFVFWIGVAGINLYFWIIAFASLMRNSLLKLIHLKNECAPERVGFWEVLLLRCDRRHNKVIFSAKKNELNIQQLSASEKNFLYVTLCDTIAAYFDSDKHFHGCLLLTAVKRAVAMCQQERKYRKEVMLQIIEQSRGRSGFLATLQIWMAQLQNVTDTYAYTAPAPPTDNSVASKAVREVEHHMHRMQKMREVILKDRDKNASVHHEGHIAVPVEDLQIALMLCWPDIQIHRPRFFTMEKPPPEETATQSLTLSTEGLDKLLTQHKSGVSLEDHLKNQAATSAAEYAAEEITAYDEGKWMEAVENKLKQHDQTSKVHLSKAALQEVDNSSKKTIPLSTVQLKRRHLELTLDLWLQKVELQALTEHFNTLTKDAGVDDEELPVVDPGELYFEDENGNHCMKHSTCFLKNLTNVDLSFLRDDHLAVVQFGEKLMEIVKSMKKKELLVCAVDTLQYGARMLSLHYVRLDALTVPSGGEIPGASTNPFSATRAPRRDRFNPEAKVIDMLKQGVGWRELEARALNTVVLIKQVIEDLRQKAKNQTSTEANALEAWLLNVSRGLVSNRGFKDGKTSQNEAELLGWRTPAQHTFEQRVARFLEHLRVLNRLDEAEVVRRMVERLMEMGNMLISMAPSERDRSASHHGKDILQIIIEENQKLGPVVKDLVDQLQEVSTVLRKDGMEDESLAVTGMIDELTRELFTAYGLSQSNSAESSQGEEADAGALDALAENGTVDNGAGVGQYVTAM